jgi:hypothetical protein
MDKSEFLTALRDKVKYTRSDFFMTWLNSYAEKEYPKGTCISPYNITCAYIIDSDKLDPLFLFAEAEKDKYSAGCHLQSFSSDALRDRGIGALYYYRPCFAFLRSEAGNRAHYINSYGKIPEGIAVIHPTQTGYPTRLNIETLGRQFRITQNELQTFWKLAADAGWMKLINKLTCFKSGVTTHQMPTTLTYESVNRIYASLVTSRMPVESPGIARLTLLLMEHYNIDLHLAVPIAYTVLRAPSGHSLVNIFNGPVASNRPVVTIVLYAVALKRYMNNMFTNLYIEHMENKENAYICFNLHDLLRLNSYPPAALNANFDPHHDDYELLLDVTLSNMVSKVTSDGDVVNILKYMGLVKNA